MSLFELDKPRRSRDVPYPATQELFLLARQVFARDLGVDSAQVKDVRLGSKMGYDYKYTHQWRFGKRRMFDISELDEIAQRFGIDPRVVYKVATGLWTAGQALQVIDERASVPYERIQRVLSVGPVQVDIDLEIRGDRVDLANEALEQLQDRIQQRMADGRPMVDAIESEVRRFNTFIDDLDLPRVPFYRQPAD